MNMSEPFSHSLLAARLLNRVSDQFGRRLGMEDLFRSPTVEGLSKFLSGDLVDRKPEILDLAEEVEKHDVKDAV